MVKLLLSIIRTSRFRSYPWRIRYESIANILNLALDRMSESTPRPFIIRDQSISIRQANQLRKLFTVSYFGLVLSGTNCVVIAPACAIWTKEFLFPLSESYTQTTTYFSTSNPTPKPRLPFPAPTHSFVKLTQHFTPFYYYQAVCEPFILLTFSIF